MSSPIQMISALILVHTSEGFVALPSIDIGEDSISVEDVGLRPMTASEVLGACAAVSSDVQVATLQQALVPKRSPILAPR